MNEDEKTLWTTVFLAAYGLTGETQKAKADADAALAAFRSAHKED
jgi:hypothetical protein